VDGTSGTGTLWCCFGKCADEGRIGDCENEFGEDDEDEEDVSEYVIPLKVWLNISPCRYVKIQ
jgi:hypothetical protein